jgi:hypothetical protein
MYIDRCVTQYAHSPPKLRGLASKSRRELQADDRFQFERHGYFVADRKDHTVEHTVFNRTTTLKDTWAKD